MISSQNYSASIAVRQGEHFLYGRSSMRPLELMQETTESQPNFVRPKFETIDDLLDLARKLVEGLNILGERKYPLDIRRGVKFMEREKKSEMLKASAKTYFFDIKETREGKPYLIITESRLKGEGEKPERTSIMVFQENIEEFAGIVTKMAEKVVQQGK
jgi:hypothetical protein